MYSQVPVWMSFSILFVYINLIVMVTFGLVRILQKLQVKRGSASLWGTSMLLTTWLSLALALGIQGLFLTGLGEPAPRIAYAFIPLLAGIALLLVSPFYRRIVDEVPPQWIIGLQTNRIIGILFLVNYFQGRLPAQFAIPAGVGDALVGLSAPIVAYLIAAKHPQARRLGILWNLAGVLDLFVAIATGVLTSPGPFHRLAFESPNLLMSAYPFVIIPAFGVPVWLLLHFYALRRLTLEREKRTSKTAIPVYNES